MFNKNNKIKNNGETINRFKQEILNLLAYYSSSLAILEKYDKNKC